MRFERLTTTEDAIYAEAMALYQISFPYHEQREAASQAQIMHHADYQFNLIYDEDKFVGLLLCWETERFIYVEHFCILPAMRNKKYGQRAMELLNRRGKTVILEIDPPVDEISIRRKAFYTRVGFQANPFAHVHPAYHVGCAGHPLVVMSCPEPLTKELYDAFAHYLRTVIMDKQRQKMELKLIRATTDHAELIWKMQVEAFAELLEKYQDFDTNPSSEPIEKVILRLGQSFTYYYMLRLNEDIVGAIRVIDHHDNTKDKRISPIFVLPQYRNQGIAQKAISEVERIHGSENWALETILQEKGNCKLYEKMGYHTTGKTEIINNKMTLVFYKK